MYVLLKVPAIFFGLQSLGVLRGFSGLETGVGLTFSDLGAGVGDFLGIRFFRDWS